MTHPVRIALLAVALLGAAVSLGGCTFTCNDACRVRLECTASNPGEASLDERDDCAEQCVLETEKETPEQRARREACWDCYQKNSCDRVSAGACADSCP